MQPSVEQVLREKLGIEPGQVRLPGQPREFFEDIREEEITPLRAMELIAATWERYQNGRNFYPTRIEKIKAYADKMARGEWVTDAPLTQTIDVTDGIVTGGRHRLHAVLLSHTPIKAKVRYRRTKET